MRAEYLALIAAMLNGTIGVFTRFGLQAGLTPSVLAFINASSPLSSLLSIAYQSPSCVSNAAHSHDTGIIMLCYPFLGYFVYISLRLGRSAKHRFP